MIIELKFNQFGQQTEAMVNNDKERVTVIATVCGRTMLITELVKEYIELKRTGD